jgi:Xaa-Pro dipeptidase
MAEARPVSRSIYCFKYASLLPGLRARLARRFGTNRVNTELTAVSLTVLQGEDKMRSTMPTAINQRVNEIQQALCDVEIDGWLFYDFRGSDPLAYRILQLDPTIHVTRRWYYWIPAQGVPVKLLHRIEPHVLDALPGQVDYYVSWEQQRQILARLLAGGLRVAMQYSHLNAVPYVSRVDAGTIELIRSYDVDVVSSADLIQRFEACWTDHQLESHQFAALALRRIVDQTFSEVRETITQGRGLTEYGVQQFIVARIREAGMVTSSAPIVAVNDHSADPHYGPTEIGSAEVTRDALLLIDLWAKRSGPGSVYADITWTGYVGRTVPTKHREIFDLVRQGRDAALAFVRIETTAGRRPFGWEVDNACRQVIQHGGYGDHFVHRTGHSIGEEVHGNGANIDGLETQDTRRLMPRTCFSIEPGIYLPGEFGIRSELDVYLAEREALVFGLPLQSEIVPLL